MSLRTRTTAVKRRLWWPIFFYVSPAPFFYISLGGSSSWAKCPVLRDKLTSCNPGRRSAACRAPSGPDSSSLSLSSASSSSPKNGQRTNPTSTSGRRRRRWRKNVLGSLVAVPQKIMTAGYVVNSLHKITSQRRKKHSHATAEKSSPRSCINFRKSAVPADAVTRDAFRISRKIGASLFGLFQTQT